MGEDAQGTRCPIMSAAGGLVGMDQSKAGRMRHRCRLRLRRLHWQISPDLFKLVGDYRVELENYIGRRDKARSSRGGRGKPPANAAMIVRATLDRLKFLDVIRGDTRQLEIVAVEERNGP